MSQATSPRTWIHRVRIENFRRFAVGDWTLKPGINCLIGAGDAGKSALLTAIEYALWPSFALAVQDNDFHRGNLDADLVIQVWIVNPPAALRSDTKFLQYLQGFDGIAVLAEPSESEDDPTVLQLELRVSGDLEPTWSVVKSPLHPRPIRATDRSSLGMSRIGEDLEKHLRWTRGSALMRLTADAASAQDVVRNATRAARAGSSTQLRAALAGITAPITDASRQLRALPTGSSLVAGSDSDANTRGLGQVTLHTDHDVPATRSGQGTQRLVAIAAQMSTASQPGILLLDELEQGLEPHRVQHLVAALKRSVTEGKLSQVVVTTHSPRAIRELSASQLFRISIRQDTPCVRELPSALQGVIRWSADALLCPRVLVCEGATEVGIIRGLVNDLQAQDPPLYATVEAVDAQGSSRVVERANALHRLGYDVAVIYDLDKIPDALDQLVDGILEFPPQDGNATEHQLFTDLDDDGVRRAFGMAQDMGGVDLADITGKLRSRGCGSDEINARRPQGCPSRTRSGPRWHTQRTRMVGSSGSIGERPLSRRVSPPWGRAPI